MTSVHTLRKDTSVYLIGTYESQIVGNKLPSVHQVLKTLFFNMREVKLNLRDSASLTVKEVFIFWNKARIPIREPQRCIEKLETLYKEWRNLQKNSKKTTEFYKQKEMLFISKLNDLFDIAHANALNIITIEEDKQFLLSQRRKGRPGSMCGIDVKLSQQEKRVAEKEKKYMERKLRNMRDLEETRTTVEMTSSSNSSEDDTSNEEENINIINIQEHKESEESERELDDVSPGPSASKKMKMCRGRRNIITEKLVAVLDKCRVSDRDSVHIFMAIAESLGHDVNELIINRSSIRRCRQKLREKRANKLKNQFKDLKLDTVVVHWDGKLLPAVTGNEMVERLPILITSGDVEQILNIPTLEAATGRGQAVAIYDALVDWGLTEKVKALCCDTTSSNLGRLKGACVLLEQMLEKDLLYLPCRHHIYELVLRSVFEIKMPSSIGPNVPIFKRFQKLWPKFNKTKFLPGTDTAKIRNLLGDDLEEIISFAKQTLEKQQQPRNDYKEFLELVLIFVGETPSRGIFFHIPGAFHHARWMAKAIYCLKIFLFRNEFEISAEEMNGISDICVFLIKIYVKAWFRAPFPAEAPNQDLQFIKRTVDYSTIDLDISRAVINKIKNHLWYLSSEAIALAFFDSNVSLDVKRKMIDALKTEKSSSDIGIESIRRIIVDTDVSKFAKRGIEYFVSRETKTFFHRFNINLRFLDSDPSSWPLNNDFQKGVEIVKKLKVVNDSAERGVKLIQDYQNHLTKDENQKQFILQIVSDYRHHFPDATKFTVSKRL